MPPALPGDLLRYEGQFHWPLQPDYRNVDAFEFVVAELMRIAKSDGIARATVQRDVLVARAEAASLEAHDVQVAIAFLAESSTIVLEGDAVRLVRNATIDSSPRAQFEASRDDVDFTRTRLLLDTCIQGLREVRAKAQAGKPLAENALELFDHALDSLGHPAFKAWWAQVRGEWARAEVGKSNLMITVLSAVLVEGALSFAATTAISSRRSMTKHLDGNDPTSWKFERLIKAAVTGQDRIFDERVAERCNRLNELRKRIHAGAMLASAWRSKYDAQGDEAIEAKETARIAVGAVLDWIARGQGHS